MLGGHETPAEGGGHLRDRGRPFHQRGGHLNVIQGAVGGGDGGAIATVLDKKHQDLATMPTMVEVAVEQFFFFWRQLARQKAGDGLVGHTVAVATHIQNMKWRPAPCQGHHWPQ